MCQTGFSDTAWGDASCNYVKSTRALSKAKFNAVIEEAQVYVKQNQVCNSTDTTDAIDVVEHACVIRHSQSWLQNVASECGF